MTRWSLPFLLLAFHTQPETLPIAKPIIVMAEYDVAEYRRNNAVRQEAKRWGVPFVLAISVSRAEVYNADSTAVSRVGAVGIMQIMPGNVGVYDHDCYGPGDMTNLRRNACTGMLLLREYYDQTGNWGAALRRYVGFVNNYDALFSYTDDIIEHMVGLE